MKIPLFLCVFCGQNGKTKMDIPKKRSANFREDGTEFLIELNKQIKEIIDKSLDLSRSFPMSLMVNPGESLMQLSNITTVLRGSVYQDLSLNDINGELSIVPGNLTLTYESHLYRKISNSTGGESSLGSSPWQNYQVGKLVEELRRKTEGLETVDLESLQKLERKLKETEAEDLQVYDHPVLHWTVFPNSD